MQQNSDFVDLIRAFNAHNVTYLIVGAHALAAHGHIRATKDLDVFVEASLQNAERVYAALAAFGAPLGNISHEDLATEGNILQIGVAPLRIDVMTRIDGITFADACSDALKTTFAGEPVAVLSQRALIINKVASGRIQDLADLEKLRPGPEPST